MKAAPLTSSLLLARKGDARPALAPAKDAVAPLVAALGVTGPRAEARSLATVIRPVPDVPAGEDSDAERPVPRTRFAFDGGGPGGNGPDGSGSVRLSVRLDRDRHRKLRILAAQRGLSLQKALIQAIDSLVSASAGEADASHCACLRETGPRLVPGGKAPVRP